MVLLVKWFHQQGLINDAGLPAWYCLWSWISILAHYFVDIYPANIYMTIVGVTTLFIFKYKISEIQENQNRNEASNAKEVFKASKSIEWIIKMHLQKIKNWNSN